VDQINGISFVMAEKPLGTGAETLTFSSPKSQNVLSVDRLKELRNNIQEAENDTQVTSLLITATVADTGDPFDFSERIETKDTKTISSGLAFIDTCSMASDISIRQHSLNHLANTYYDTILYNITQRKKLAVTFSNGQIPLDAVYLFLGLGFIRVLTEHSLLQFHLSLSHAPIPPLLLLAMARMRKPLPAGLELYLALGAPAHGKLRGPELLQLGLADIFVPEAKLSDAFEMAKRMAVCPGPDTPAAVQLALAIQHTYAGPNRLSVWEEYITKVFGNVESLEDIEQRLKNTDNAWSKTILDHWHTLPPALLRAVFKAVNAINTATSPTELLNLEQNLNAKWRQTDDYRAWVSSSNEWVHDKEQVDALVDFYFDGGDSKASSEKLVVYEAPQDTEDEPVVCPVTGQKSSSGAGVCPVGGASSKTISVCPVTGRRSEDTQEANICPATGQCAANTEANNEDNKCPVANMNKDKAMCPVTGQKSEDNKQLLETEGCPFSKLQLSSTTQDTVCPVSGMKSLLSDQ
jgi:enoyl-CoA hydratase/carnithine racemase